MEVKISSHQKNSAELVDKSKASIFIQYYSKAIAPTFWRTASLRDGSNCLRKEPRDLLGVSSGFIRMIE